MLRIVLAVGSLCVAIAMPGSTRGVVVDASGRPLVGAVIAGHALAVTGADGRFDMPASAGRVRVLIDGYAPQIVSTAAAAEPIVMRVASSRRRDLPPCGLGQGGRGAGVLHIQRPRGVDVITEGGDDTVTTTWSRRGAALRHSAGPTTTNGLPLDVELSALSDVDDRDVRLVVDGLGPHGIPIADVRGRYPDGRRYRYVGFFGEMFLYDGITAGEAAVFDRMLDAMCHSAPLKAPSSAQRAK